MKLRQSLSTIVILAAMCLSSTLFAQNNAVLDRILLKSGGELVGSIQSESQEAGKTFVVFETESGGILKLDKNRLIRTIFPADGLATEYAVRAAADVNSPEAHWAVVEWCQEQKSGRTRFKKEIEFHLLQIVEVDPNDKKAWQKLGYVRREGGVWTKDEKMFAISGYTKVNGKWKSNQLAGVSQRLQNNDQARRDGVIAFKKWEKSLRKNGAATARVDLFSIMSTTVVPPLYEFSREHRDARVRRLAVDAIATVDSSVAIEALVNFAIQDPDVGVRQAAATSLENEKHFGPEQVAAMVVRGGFLHHQQNEFVDRAGRLLGQVQSEAAILPLINALQTTHKVSTGRGQGRTQARSVGGEVQGLDTGGGQSTVDVISRNQAVAGALRAITKKEFGFDKAAATAWYIENYSYTEMELRGSD